MFADERGDIQKPSATRGHNLSNLDVFRRMRAPIRRQRAQSYRTIDGLSAERDTVAWYWKVVAMGSAFMILGGFLMLPATFETKPDVHLRAPQAVIGIFAIALLAAGFSFTGLLCLAVRNPLFQSENIFLPALISCALGLLTIVYDFLIFKTYAWALPATLTTVAAAVGTVAYGGLLIWGQRRVAAVKAKGQAVQPVPMMHVSAQGGGAARGGVTGAGGGSESRTALWQNDTYYENYNRNMFPSAYPPSHSQYPQPPTGYDPNALTEEEMQRQQMLMLLLHRGGDDQPSPDPTSSTYNIDWQEGVDHEARTPINGYYGPTPNSAVSSVYTQTPVGYTGPSVAGVRPAAVRQWSGHQEMRPWDGVWREVRRPSGGEQERESRRREIEMSGGRR